MCGVLVILPRASATAVILVLCMALLICLLCHVGQQELELQPVYRQILAVCCLDQYANACCDATQDEAFQLWTEDWANLYEKNSRSYKIIQDIVDHWFLVSVVENDYVHGDLFKVLLGTTSKDDQVEEVAAAWNPASEQQQPEPEEALKAAAAH